MAAGKSVCFGFPYTDTLKILEKFGPGCHFYGRGDDADLDALEALLAAQGPEDARVQALFCEFPSNPLLRSPPLARIRRLADTYGLLVVVDETIGNFVNVEVLPFADVLVSSLTKVFSGDANVMGGSLVLNPRGRAYSALREAASALYEDTFFAEDAIFMERNSRDFVRRVARIDANTLAVTELLWCEMLGRGHYPGVVKQVYYPKYQTRHYYDVCRRQHAFASGTDELAPGGYGGLFSITFTSLVASEAFYDNLACAKGPSLGTNLTLACPYTILAHYTELDWAAQFGVEQGLVRVSVGLEDVSWLRSIFTTALRAAAEATATATAAVA
jgi:cystathionine gamma-synthase